MTKFVYLRGMRQTLSPVIFLLFGVCFLMGCSVNEFGIVNVRNVEASMTKENYVSAPGLHLDVRRNDVTMTLGQYERFAVQTNTCLTSTGCEHTQPIFVALYVKGLHFAVSLRRIEFLLGYKQELTRFVIDSSQGSAAIVTSLYALPESFTYENIYISD